jgi:N-hydroxyarylamine O-acetyltransferase
MLDLAAYLDRIGLSGRPALANVHRAHATAIPFENLDPLRGVAVSLAPEDLERKIVDERRGGYCFEQNLLLKAALEALGAEVEPLLARVRIGSASDAVRPRSHLVLRVRERGMTWHADVGFGRGGLLEPIPFGPRGPYEQSGWRFRVVQDGPELVLQSAAEGRWVDLYGLNPEPVPFVDLETSNWFTCTYPRSPFVTGLIVGVNRSDGTRVALVGWEEINLIEQSPERTATRTVSRQAVPDLLASSFGLPGFAISRDGSHLVRVGEEGEGSPVTERHR